MQARVCKDESSAGNLTGFPPGPAGTCSPGHAAREGRSLGPREAGAQCCTAALEPKALKIAGALPLNPLHLAARQVGGWEQAPSTAGLGSLHLTGGSPSSCSPAVGP